MRTLIQESELFVDNVFMSSDNREKEFGNFYGADTVVDSSTKLPDDRMYSNGPFFRSLESRYILFTQIDDIFSVEYRSSLDHLPRHTYNLCYIKDSM